MAELICTAITSLDGYIADEQGNLDWGAPDNDVHAFIDDLERPIGTLPGPIPSEVVEAEVAVAPSAGCVE
jgi:hypothetical protein